MKRIAYYGIIALSALVILLFAIDALLLGPIMQGVVGWTSRDIAIAISRTPVPLQSLIISYFLRGGVTSSSVSMREMVLILGYAEDHQVDLEFDRRLLIPFFDGEYLSVKYNDINFKESVGSTARKIVMNYGDEALVKKVFDKYKDNSNVIRKFCNAPRGDIDLTYMRFTDSTCNLHLQNKS